MKLTSTYCDFCKTECGIAHKNLAQPFSAYFGEHYELSAWNKEDVCFDCAKTIRQAIDDAVRGLNRSIKVVVE